MAGGVELATAYISLIVSGDKVAPGVRSALGSADMEAQRAGDRAGRSFTKRFGASLKVGASLAAGFAAVKGVQFLGDAVQSASTLGESLNAVNVTFGRNARGIKRLGEQAAESVGLSNAAFNGLAVQFSAFSKTIAGDGGNVVKTLDDLTTRGADFASVMDLDVNEAMRLFQSGLAGETEPLRRFGLNLSAAAVESFAYAQGIAKTGEELTEAQKVQARYGLLMKQTAKTSGDFANTSDSLANSQRRLGAQWEDLKAEIGGEVLPVFEDLSNWVADDALPAMSQFFDEMKRGKGFGGDVAEVLGTVRNVLGDVVPLAKDMVGAFADMPKWAQTAVVGGGAAALLGGKALGGRGGGGLGGIVSKASPVPVFVTNMGAGIAGGAGKSGKLGKLGKGGGALSLLTLSAFLADGATKQPKGGALGPGITGGDIAKTAEKFDDLTVRLNKTLGALVKARTGVNDLSGAFSAYDKLISQHIRSNPEEGFRALELFADKAGVSVEELAGVLPKASRAIDKTGVSVDSTKGKTRDWMNTILGTGRSIDDVDKKKPNVPFTFPGLLDGISKGRELDRTLDQAAQDRTARITIVEQRVKRTINEVIDSVNPFNPRDRQMGYSPRTSGRQAGGGGALSLTITNWDEGTGYISGLADERISAADSLAWQGA